MAKVTVTRVRVGVRYMRCEGVRLLAQISLSGVVHASGWAAGVDGRACGTRPAAGVSCMHTLQPSTPHHVRPLSRSQTNRASGEHAVGIRSVAQKSFLYGHSGRPGIQKEPTVAHHPRAPHMK